jgi:hypothetical protein
MILYIVKIDKKYIKVSDGLNMINAKIRNTKDE